MKLSYPKALWMGRLYWRACNKRYIYTIYLPTHTVFVLGQTLLYTDMATSICETWLSHMKMKTCVETEVCWYIAVVWSSKSCSSWGRAGWPVMEYYYAHARWWVLCSCELLHSPFLSPEMMLMAVFRVLKNAFFKELCNLITIWQRWWNRPVPIFEYIWCFTWSLGFKIRLRFALESGLGGTFWDWANHSGSSLSSDRGTIAILFGLQADKCYIGFGRGCFTDKSGHWQR